MYRDGRERGEVICSPGGEGCRIIWNLIRVTGWEKEGGGFLLAKWREWGEGRAIWMGGRGGRAEYSYLSFQFSLEFIYQPIQQLVY